MSVGEAATEPLADVEEAVEEAEAVAEAYLQARDEPACRRWKATSDRRMPAARRALMP